MRELSRIKKTLKQKDKFRNNTKQTMWIINEDIMDELGTNIQELGQGYTKTMTLRLMK